MAKKSETVAWNEVDVSSFKGELSKSYSALKAAQIAAAKARTDFESKARSAFEKADLLPDGVTADRLVFSYRFGKLSVGVADRKAEKAPGKPKLSL